METLMADIRALGRLPRREKCHGDESALANRLREAKRQRRLSESQLAELAGFAESQTRERMASTRERMETLMADIRALGRLPLFKDDRRDEYGFKDYRSYE